MLIEKDGLKLYTDNTNKISNMSFLADLKNLTHIKIGKTKITAENKDLFKNVKNVDLYMVGIRR